MGRKTGCENCGKEQYKHDCYIKRSKSGIFFCSWECQRAYRKKQKVFTRCPACGKEFYAKPYRRKRAGAVACSPECRMVILGWGSQIVACDWCGKEFSRKNTQINKHNFCSRKCMGKWQSQNLTGENHPSWRGGYKQYYGPTWKRQRRKARQRDNYTCQTCNLTESQSDHALEVHHIKPFRLFDNHSKANYLSNLITLCRDCHVAADAVARRIFDEGWNESHIRKSLENYSTVFRLYFYHP